MKNTLEERKFIELLKEAIREVLQEEQVLPSKDQEPVSITEIASALGKSRQTIYNWMHRGEIPFHRAGSRVIFFKEEVFRFLKGRE